MDVQELALESVKQKMKEQGINNIIPVLASRLQYRSKPVVMGDDYAVRLCLLYMCEIEPNNQPRLLV